MDLFCAELKLPEFTRRKSQLEQKSVDETLRESVQTRSFFSSVFSCIQSEYRKIRTWKNPVLRHFSRSNTREIAAMRIHVERVIGLLLDKFTILQGIWQIKMIIKTDDGTCKLTHISTIYSKLCDLCSSVIPVGQVSWNSKKQPLWNSQSHVEIYGENHATCNITQNKLFSNISSSFSIWGFYLTPGTTTFLKVSYKNHFSYHHFSSEILVCFFIFSEDHCQR